MTSSVRLLLGTIAIGLTGVFGCATQVDGTGGNAVGGSGPTTTSGTGSTSATMATSTSSASGTGGSGGMSLCAMDCSAIDTPECLKAVCNDGSFVGPIGSCVVVPDTGATCDDGLFCTLDDKCDDMGECVGGAVNDCNLTPGQCMKIECDEDLDTCAEVGSFVPNQPCLDGSECESGSCTNNKCDAPSCVPTDLCMIGGACDATGACVGTPKDCTFSPLTECNTVACNPANGKCEGTPNAAKNGMACTASGDLCKVGKTCQAGACQGGTAKDCSAFAGDCTLGVCNATNGACQSQPIPAGGMCAAATDGCNQGYCNASGMCLPMPLMDGTACNDGNLCTNMDSCTAGTCGGQPVMGCSAYFADSFEVCPGGWTFAGEWQCGVAATTVSGSHPPTGPQDGANVIGTNLAGNYQNNDAYASHTATSQVIDLTGTTNPVLSFYLWVDTEGASTVYDGANLRISQDGGAFNLVGAGPTCTAANQCTVVNMSKPYHSALVLSQPAWGGIQYTSGWQFVTVDLTPYVGHQIQFRYSFGSEGSGVFSGVYIDNVKITEPNAVPLNITTASLGNAYSTFAYSANLARVGGSASAVWSIAPGGTNTSWLSINPSTGQLTGTPTAANLGPVTVTIHVEEPSLPSNFDDQTFTFNVVQALYTESFEGACPNGWTLTGDWQCGVPTSVGPPTAYAGTQCLATVINGTYNNNLAYATTTATSPPYTLSGAAPKITWKAWVHTESGAYDAYNILVSTNGGATFTQLTGVTPAYTGSVSSQQAWYGQNQSWQTYQADLSAYTGQTVLIRYAFRSDGIIVYPGVYIDDIVVTAN